MGVPGVPSHPRQTPKRGAGLMRLYSTAIKVDMSVPHLKVKGVLGSGEPVGAQQCASEAASRAIQYLGSATLGITCTSDTALKIAGMQASDPTACPRIHGHAAVILQNISDMHQS